MSLELAWRFYPSEARAEARAEQIRSLDPVGLDGAVEMLLDQIRLAFLDSLQTVRDVKPVRDFVGVRIDKVQFCRISEPGRDQRCRFDRARPLSDPSRDEGAELGVLREARGYRS